MDWIKSHQDDTEDLCSLSREVALNVRMDRDTRAAYNLLASWQTQDFVPVLHAEGCALYIGNRKLTSHVHSSALEKWNDQAAAPNRLNAMASMPISLIRSIGSHYDSP